MKKVTLGIMALLFAAAFVLVPAGADAEGQIYHEGTNVFEVDSDKDFEISYTLPEGSEDKDISYSAYVENKKGETMVSAVTPSDGTMSNGEVITLTVTAPSDAGKYTLKVDFTVGEDTTTESYAFTAVNPITLTVNLECDDVTLNLESYGVYFYVDGEKIDDSYTTVTLSNDGSGSITYDWIADPERGAHTFCVKAVGGGDLIQGLDEEHTFYIGDNDYALVIALAFIILIILIIEVIRIYRKPVKNYGKPKSRR